MTSGNGHNEHEWYAIEWNARSAVPRPACALGVDAVGSRAYKGAAKSLGRLIASGV